MSFAFSKQINLNVEELKKQYQSEDITVFNIHTKRLESYRGIPFNHILTKKFGKKWQKSFAIKVIAKDGYEAHIETYKFLERNAYLVYERTDQKVFSAVIGASKVIVKLKPAYLTWKENYKEEAKNTAAKRNHHWPFGVVAYDILDVIPPEILPYSNKEDITWGMKNYFKQCIHCHQINGVGGTKGIDLFKNQGWKNKGKDWLKKYIDNPKNINPKSRMPVFPLDIDIRKTRINNIIDYLYDVTDTQKKLELNRNVRSKALRTMLKNNRL